MTEPGSWVSSGLVIKKGPFVSVSDIGDVALSEKIEELSGKKSLRTSTKVIQSILKVV